MSLEILRGQPSEEELAAVVAALQVFKLRSQVQLALAQPIQVCNRWQISERLQQTMVNPWGMAGSAWQRSERLANPWLD